jgi:NAD(P)-dependent dehydrogenase (short-subunit alcohol dehydrogenase family)
MTTKTWFITGASKGFGREWAEAALERVDRVAATARDPRTLDELVNKYGEQVLPLQLDVNDHDADFAAVQQAAQHFGRLDVVVNNAGYGHFGMTPLRVFFGRAPIGIAKADYESRLATWDEWQPVALEAHGR